MIECTFELNNKPMSSLKCNGQAFPAFSGLSGHRNSRSSACLQDEGPIPPGIYYIIDRQSGGLLGPLRDLFRDHDTWFALYANDGKIDDEVVCNKIKRGSFRIHPKGTFGISKGCITIESIIDFQRLRVFLKGTKQESIPGTNISAYGKVVVK